MLEQVLCVPIPVVYPGSGAALADDYAYMVFPFSLTLIAVSVAPDGDDADATWTMEDDGTPCMAAFACEDANVPSTWESTAVGGSNDPVVIAKDSKISFTVGGTVDNGRQFVGYFLALVHEDA